MAVDKLGRYIRSKAFLERANSAVEKAVSELEASGVKPVYIERTSRRAVLDEVRARGQYLERCNRLNRLMCSPAGARQVDAATTATASALLLAKTAMPSEETKFLSEIRRQIAPVHAEPALIEWAQSIIDVELGSPGSMRDRAGIDDALFEQRIRAIRQVLDGPEARPL